MNAHAMIKEYKRTNRLEFFINALIKVIKDMDSESNYNGKDLNRSDINKLTNKEQLYYFN